MKRWLIWIGFCLPVVGLAQVPFDGPYVRYENDKVLVSTITQDEDLLRLKTDTFGTRSQVLLQVAPAGHREWAFTVKLRDTLTNDAVTYPKTGKTLFMSDIEGEFAGFRKLLLAAGVMDSAYR